MSSTNVKLGHLQPELLMPLAEVRKRWSDESSALLLLGYHGKGDEQKPRRLVRDLGITLTAMRLRLEQLRSFELALPLLLLILFFVLIFFLVFILIIVVIRTTVVIRTIVRYAPLFFPICAAALNKRF